MTENQALSGAVMACVDKDPKKLRALIADLQKREASCRADADSYKASIADLQKRASAIERDAAGRANPQLSDHALVRYMERKHGLNLDRFREEIMTESTIGAIRAGCKAVSVDGVRFVVKDGVIVTVLD